MSSAEDERGPAPRPRRFYTPPERLEAAGVALGVRRAGSGPPLLFLHGASFSRMWLPLHRALAERFTVVAPEHPGYGETPRSGRVASLDDLAGVYLALLGDLGHERAHLAGWSLGGWIAALMAGERPDRVLSLTLVTPAGLTAPGPSPPPDLSTPERLWDAMFLDHSRREEVVPDYDDPDEVAQLDFEGETRRRLSEQATAGEALERRLAHVSGPGLVIGAERDLIVPDGVADRFAAALPAGRLERLPGTGHGLIVERPERVAELIATNADASD